MSAVVDFDSRIAATLASEPEMVLAQMRQHRDIVAGLRADIRERDKVIARLRAQLGQYECPCGETAETIEFHSCRANLYEAELEDGDPR